MDQDATWFGGRPRPRPYCARGAQPPIFGPCLLCTEVGLGPDHIVLDGDPAPHLKGAQSPLFGLCLLWPNGAGWIKMSLGTKVGLGQATLCYMRIQFPKKGHSTQFLWSTVFLDVLSNFMKNQRERFELFRKQTHKQTDRRR